MASEPPLILAFDTSAARCAAALVSGRRGARRAATRRWSAARPSGCCRCSRSCWPRPGVGWADLDGARGLHRAGQLHRAAHRRRRGARAGAGARRAVGRGDARSRRWPRRPGAADGGDRRPQGATVFVQRVPRRRGARRRRRPATHPSPTRRRRRCGSTARRSRGSRRGGSGARRRRRRSTCGRPTRCRRRSRRPPSSMTPEALAALHALAFDRRAAAVVGGGVRGAPRRASTLLSRCGPRASRSGGWPGRRPSC